MSAASDEYISKMAKLDTATNAITKVIENLRGFAEPLIRNWRECSIQEQGRGIPMDMAGRPQIIDAFKYPTARQISEALVAHHEAEQQAKTAWNHLSDAERNHMAPPYWARRSR